MFQPVGSRVNFPESEARILEMWREKDIFARSVTAREGNRRFVFYEGPPTANGSPGIHHVLARVFKDILLRYRTMKGDYVPRIAGWDTHGLPVELEVEKRKGFSSKTDIETFGIANFNALCRESVFRYLEEWKSMTERIAFWVDLDGAYVTMDNEYIETGWWVIKQLWDRGLVYQGYRVTPHCPRCGTSLSSHEVALGYKDDTEDPSVYIKFKVAAESIKHLEKFGVRSDLPVYFLAWTTTPWTLAGNTALAIASDADYAAVETEGEQIIMAEARLGCTMTGEYSQGRRMKGADLVGVQYEPLYNVPIASAGTDKPAYRVVAGDFVSMEDGTGIVHIAPAYGEIDFDVGEREGLPLVQTVGLDGKVRTTMPSGSTPEVRRNVAAGAAAAALAPKEVNLPGAGKFVKKADPEIIEDLKTRNLLYRSENIKHTYPFCWRCDTPLLYYAKQSWYIKTTAVKDALIAGNKEINWFPEHVKEGRFGDWLKNNVDWAFSRERYWGTPLPVWHCPACGRHECVGGVDELKRKPGLAGLKEPLDLHRPFVDDVTYSCAQCGGRMLRVPEVIDCWFDSGVMPLAQHHYPFEAGTLLEDGRFPADYICEAVDQTRGWFYSLHAVSTLLFNRPSYRNVICLGHILDAKGEKMSKARGNVVDPWLMLNKYGADALRWYFYTSSPPGNVRRFDERQVAEVPRRFMLTLWNVYSFFVTYANIDRFTPGRVTESTDLSELDRWILSELNQLIGDVDRGLDGYDPTEAGRKIESFVEELSTWYVRRSRRRFWKSESDADKHVAYDTLYRCLVTLAKLLAPFTPFVAEAMYRNLVCSVSPAAPESVHLADFPVADLSCIDKQLSADVQSVMRVASLGRAARSQAGIKVRQPLAKAVVKPASSSEKEALRRLESQILEELNVKSLEFADSDHELFQPESGFAVATEFNYAVAVPKTVSSELAAEGTARDIVHRLQTMRRSAGFEIADYITTYFEGDDYIRQVLADFGDYVRQETLSRQLVAASPPDGAYVEKFKLAGHDMVLAVMKL